jgi:NADH dehydrogenase
MRITVAGATGYHGSRAVEVLAQRGHEVKALVRAGSPGGAVARRARVQRIDFADFAALVAALRGSDALLISLSRRPGSATGHGELAAICTRLIHAAGQADVPLVARLTAHVSAADAWLSEGFAAQRQVDAVLRSAPGGQRLLVQVASFCKDLDVLYRMIQARGVCLMAGPGTRRIRPLHPDDLASYLARSLEQRWSGLREVVIGGPVEVSLLEMARACFRVLGRRERILHLPLSGLQRLLRASVPLAHLPRLGQWRSYLGLFYVGFARDHLGQPVGVHTPYEYLRQLAGAPAAATAAPPRGDAGGVRAAPPVA